MLERHARSLVDEGLDEARIVAILGARQVGKSTLLEQVAAERGGRVITLDDRDARLSAQDDPATFISQFPAGLLAIDEIQRVPDVMLALKVAVDQDKRPGRFLVTGSADLHRLPTVADSMAGRVQSVPLYGFSQGELTGHTESFWDAVFAGHSLMNHTSHMGRGDYLDLAVAGSYPEVLARKTYRSRVTWLSDYLERIVTRDARDIAAIRDLDALAATFKALVPTTGETLNIQSLASKVGISAKTTIKYIDLLKNLYLIHQLPAWHTNLLKKVASKPKTFLLDSGLAASQVGATASALAPGGHLEDFAGALIETFVAAELRKQASWSNTRIRLYHWRTHDGAEVDILAETPDGRIVGIEVKASTNPGRGASKWLGRLRDLLADRFVAGIVLCSRGDVIPMGDRIWHAPIDTIWTA